MNSLAKKAIFIVPVAIVAYILFLSESTDIIAVETNSLNTGSAASTSSSAKDGYFTDWSEWSDCNKKCGGGSQGRYRAYINAKNGGVELDNKDDIIELRTCNTTACPSNGYLTEFGNWTSCDKPCGGGVVRRSRSYIPATNGGVDLTDSEIQAAGLVETKTCNSHTCPVNGIMSEWSNWSSCDKTCGGGNQTRSRSYIPAQNGGTELSESERIKLIENQRCNTNPCPTNGSMSSWSDWSSCSASCGGGTKNRTRTYTPAQNGGTELSEAERIKLIETQNCNTHSCPENGYLTAWGEWSDCNKTCGTGTKTRTRSYIAARNGGTDLSISERSNLTETLNCNTHACAANGYYSPWSNWSYCTKECGGGTQTRSRTYTPATGGGTDISPLVLSESRICNNWMCVESSGVCFDGDSYITLSDDSKKLVKELKIGDCVKTAFGSNAIINYIVKTDIEDRLLCNINNMWITPWHPVFVGGEWKYPKDITKPKENNCAVVYSLAISNGHAVFINDTVVVTMGHEFRDKIVKHEYFGSKKVIDDLEIISIRTGSRIIKNPEIHRYCGVGAIIGLS